MVQLWGHHPVHDGDGGGRVVGLLTLMCSGGGSSRLLLSSCRWWSWSCWCGWAINVDGDGGVLSGERCWYWYLLVAVVMSSAMSSGGARARAHGVAGVNNINSHGCGIVSSPSCSWVVELLTL